MPVMKQLLLLTTGIMLAGTPVRVNAAIPQERRADNRRPTADTIRADDPQNPRDPFWPVGYIPPPPKPADGEQDDGPPLIKLPPPNWEAAAALLKFQGTFRTRGRDMAAVNNRIVEPGYIIGVRVAPWIYQWRVIAIDRNGVQTVPMDVLPIE